MSRRVAWIGADPGMSGALALFAPGRVDFKPGDTDVAVAIEDMPTIKVEGGRMLDHWRLAAILGAWASTYDVKGVTIERVHAMPDQGVSSSFSFGDSFGALKQAVASAGLHFTLISPATWKGIYGLRGGRENKRASAEKVIWFFPGLKAQMFGPKGGAKDGRAEAVLLAHYGSKLQ